MLGDELCTEKSNKVMRLWTLASVICKCQLMLTILLPVIIARQPAYTRRAGYCFINSVCLYLSVFLSIASTVSE